MTSPSRTASLLAAYFRNAISREETLELADLLQGADDEELAPLLEEVWQQSTDSPTVFSPEESAAMLANILRQKPGTPPKRKAAKAGLRIAAVVLVLLFLGVVAYVQYNRTPTKQEESIPSVVPDIPPGTNKAVLILADGSLIELNDAPVGTIGRQGNSTILKIEDGQLAYNGNQTPGAILYNTIRTPRGGQYKLTLSDGTRVWLNAASSIRFPATFNGDRREVEVSGEVFFEVSADTKAPFIVAVGDKCQITVTGTQFNVNAYPDEAGIRTTLVEGSIRLSTPDGETRLLRPNQQAILEEELAVVNLPDVDAVTAWMQGWFLFDRTELPVIMRQISRWYDVDIRFEGKPGNRSFSGIVDRNNNVNEVLKIMESAGIRFTMENGTLVVFQ